METLPDLTISTCICEGKTHKQAKLHYKKSNFRNVTLQNVRIIFLLFLSFFPLISIASSQNTVKIASIEQEPYLGAQLPSNGYALEVVKKAFQRVGYKVELEFVTLARAQRIAEQGLVDGYIASFEKAKTPKQYLLSSPIPGESLGLLKKKSLDISPVKLSKQPLNYYFKQLRSYRFGLVRGESAQTPFEPLNNTKITFARDNIENINNLEKGIIDFVVIDKYTAADIITNQRPYLIGQFEIIQPSDANKPFHIAFAKNEKHLKIRQAFNRGLTEIEKDGSLKNIIEKHGFSPFIKTQNAKSKLVIGTVNNKDMLLMQSLSMTFEKNHPDVEIDWRVMDENTLRTRLLSDLSISDGQFDVITIGIQEIPTWSEKKWLHSINELPESYQVNDIFASLRHSLSYKNELYALPFYAESSVTYYRQDLLLNAGIRLGSQPTYSEILQYAEEVHNPDKGEYGICLRGKPGWGENIVTLTTMVNTYGGQWFDNQWKPQLETPAWKKALTAYKALLRFAPPGSETNGYNENLELFLRGKCGIWIDASVAAGVLLNKSTSKVSDVVAITKAPIAETPYGASWLWAWALAIPESSKNKAIAQQFITWATSQDYINMVGNNYGWGVVPPGTRISTYQNSKYIDAFPFAKVILESINNASMESVKQNEKPYSGIQFVEISEFPAIGNYVGKLISEAVQGKITIDEALKKSQRHTELQMRLANYNR